MAKNDLLFFYAIANTTKNKIIKSKFLSVTQLILMNIFIQC